jgi:hypothetical protein
MLRRWRLLVAVTIASALGAALQACTAPLVVVDFKCDPDAGPEDVFWCGPDAGAPPDAGAEGGSAALGCDCVPRTYTDWSEPGVFWMGPRDQAPSCVTFDLSFDNDGWMDLVVPPAKCAACRCEPEPAACDPLPAKVEVRAGGCDAVGASTLPFDGTAAWDGSCTNAASIPAGAKCPDGSNTPCAQSIRVGPLPKPVGEACEPSSLVPQAEIPPTTWATYGLFCTATNDDDDKCLSNGKICAPPLAKAPSGSRTCIILTEAAECPDRYNGPKFTLHTKPPIEGRSCSECTCGAPTGGLCTARFKAYEDEACSSASVVAEMFPVSSEKEVCIDLMPSGPALGSKTVTDLEYIAGTCSASGGEPTGTVQPDPDPQGVTTVCCLPEKGPVP